MVLCLRLLDDLRLDALHHAEVVVDDAAAWVAVVHREVAWVGVVLGVGRGHPSPIANPIANPIPNPIPSPIPNPIANPIANPITNPIANPIPSPSASCGRDPGGGRSGRSRGGTAARGTRW